MTLIRFKFCQQWWNIRLFAILISPIFFVEPELYFLTLVLLTVHAQLGVRNIIQDYVHNKQIYKHSNLIVRVILLQFTRINIEYWF